MSCFPISYFTKHYIHIHGLLLIIVFDQIIIQFATTIVQSTAFIVYGWWIACVYYLPLWKIMLPKKKKSTDQNGWNNIFDDMRIISATWAQITKIKITNNIMMNEMVIKNKMQRNNNGTDERIIQEMKRKKNLKLNNIHITRYQIKCERRDEKNRSSG